MLGFTLQVQTRPTTNPAKRHFYFTQTEYSLRCFPKNVNSTRTCGRYDLKGVGGASFVVAAGTERENGEYYTYENQNLVMPIPRWLVDWLVEDIRRCEILVRPPSTDTDSASSEGSKGCPGGDSFPLAHVNHTPQRLDESGSAHAEFCAMV